MKNSHNSRFRGFQFPILFCALFSNQWTFLLLGYPLFPDSLTLLTGWYLIKYVHLPENCTEQQKARLKTATPILLCLNIIIVEISQELIFFRIHLSSCAVSSIIVVHNFFKINATKHEWIDCWTGDVNFIILCWSPFFFQKESS